MFVDRKNGAVVGIYNVSQYEGQEELPDDSPDVGAFQAALDGGIGSMEPPETDEQKLLRLGFTVAALKKLLA